MDAKKFGSFIFEIRKENQMTQAELASKLNVTDKAISRWERGLGFPDINTLEPLADALGITVVELMKSEKAIDNQITTKDISEVITSTADIVESQNHGQHKLLFIMLAVLCTLMFVVFFLKNWILLKVFALAASILIIIICRPYYVQYKDYPEEKTFYTVIMICFAGIAYAVFLSLLPASVENYLELYPYLPDTITLFIQICIFFNLATWPLAREKKWKKTTIALYWTTLAVLLFFNLVMFFKHFMNVNISTDRANLTEQYATQQLINDFDISPEQINDTYTCYGPSTHNDIYQPEYYKIGFSYSTDSNNNLIYGYYIAIDDDYNFKIIRKGVTIGQSIIYEYTGEDLF